MTEELKKALMAAYEEETKDYQKYMTMAETAKSQDCHEAYKILHDIAHEEHTHAEAISNVLMCD